MWTSLCLLLVSGCTINQVQVPAGGVASAPVATAPLPAAPASTLRAIAAGAVPGKRQRIDFFAFLNADCSPIGLTDIDVLAGPAHGAVEKVKSEEFPAYLAPNVRVRCNDRRVAGMLIYYTPEPAFHGTDVFAMRYVFPSGGQVTVPVVVTVQ
jgi:hypothetical protein